jgi:predicted AAA+ superfamily ATPase
MSNLELTKILHRIAELLEKFYPTPETRVDFTKARAFIWNAEQKRFTPVDKVNCIPIELLKGINQSRDQLVVNTRQFAKGYPANNALLWGARGTGKSSLVKSVHSKIYKEINKLILIEVHREDISSLTYFLPILRDNQDFRFILFCDDLSFDTGDDTYKSLKALLDGGIEGCPENVLFYATSNRRHLLPRNIAENSGSGEINIGESAEEKISLSDRFGLWLGFHNCDQETYFEIIDAYAEEFDLKIDLHQLRAEALEWSATRGARSGRVAWQFIQDLAGRLEKRTS